MMFGALRRRTSGLANMQWKFITAEEPNLVIELGPNAAAVEFHARSEKPILANLVVRDGQTVYLSSGPVIAYSGEVFGAHLINLSVKVGQTVAYMAFVTPKPRFWVPADPIPAVVTSQQAVSAGMPDVVRELVERALVRAGIKDQVVDDVLSDLEDEEFDWSGEDPGAQFDFGPGFEEAPEDARVALGARPEPVDDVDQPAEPVPDPQPIVPPRAQATTSPRGGSAPDPVPPPGREAEQ